MGKICSKYSSLGSVIFLIVFLFFRSAGAVPQEADLFEKAYGYYLSYNPEKAIATFDQFLNQFPNSSALDSVMFWRARSLIQLNKFDEAVRDFHLMKEHFPDSAYSIFVEKELDILQKNALSDLRPDGSKEDIQDQGGAGSHVYEEKIRILEAEIASFGKKLADSERLRQLTEKRLEKALKEMNSLETQIEDARRVKEDLDKKLESAVQLEERSRCDQAGQGIVKELSEKLKKAEADTQRLRGEADALERRVIQPETSAEDRNALEAQLLDREELRAASGKFKD